MRISDWSSDVCSSDLACNQYVDAMAPWALRKTDPERMRAVLMTLFRAVRTLAIAIRPVVPAAADKLLDQMGIADMRATIGIADRGGDVEGGLIRGHARALAAAGREGKYCVSARGAQSGFGRGHFPVSSPRIKSALIAFASDRKS